MSLAAITNKLNELVKDGFACSNYGQYSGWSRRVSAFLTKAFPEHAIEFIDHMGDADDWVVSRDRQLGMLEGIAAFRSETDVPLDPVSSPSAPAAVLISNRVFVVHGHDDGTKEGVARYLEQLGLKAVILHEKPNEGRTLIEKVEAFSDVDFAVVLLTPDDIGAAKGDATNLRQRARQNVVLELGYFLGKLERSRQTVLLGEPS